MTTHSNQSYLDLIFIIISVAKRPINNHSDIKKAYLTVKFRYALFRQAYYSIYSDILL